MKTTPHLFPSLPVIEPLWVIEKRAIEAAIEHCDGQINRAARLLQIAPSTIYRKRASWKENPSVFRTSPMK